MGKREDVRSEFKEDFFWGEGDRAGKREVEGEEKERGEGWAKERR